jgi:hypothetical protein
MRLHRAALAASRLALALLLSIVPAAGCCGPSAPAAPAPKSLTIVEVQQLPLEEAGDLGIRQNLAELPRAPLLGRDTPGPNIPR